MEKYGFVYIWRDKGRGRYYIGSHWGREDDGYVCSSTWMRNSRNRRPEDFRRRILVRIYTSRIDLLEVEHKWLSLISKNDLGNKYYNIRNHHPGHWSTDENSHLSVRQKLSLARQRYVCADETRKKMSETRKKLYSDPEARAAQSLALMGKNKGRKSPFKGQKRSEEVIKKIILTKNNIIYVAKQNGHKTVKQKAADLGISDHTYLRWLKNGEIDHPLSAEERELRRRRRLSTARARQTSPMKGRPSPFRGKKRPAEVGRKISLTKQLRKATMNFSHEQKIPPPWEAEGVSRSKWYRLRKAGEAI